MSGDGAAIASIETFTTEWVGFVRVRAADGAEGIGQVSPYNADITCEVLHRQVAPHALGADPDDAEALGTRVLEAEHKYPGSYVCRALAGVDTALWDLRARRAGVPVCVLAGGAARPLAAYASSMRRDIAPADEAQRLARLRDEHGYGAFKFRVGRECGHDEDEWPGRTEAVVPAVRRALGDDARLLVDANSCYTPERAIAVGRFLEQWGVEHFEEPCPYWELGWTAQVTAALDLAVAGGEQDCFLWQWRRMVEGRAVDVVQPDVCYVGGFTRALAVARMAAAAGLPCTPHSANLSLVTVFAQHLLCAIGNAGPYLELSIEGPDYYPWQYELFDPPIAIADGRMPAPQAPGWGVELNPRWLAAAAQADLTASLSRMTDERVAVVTAGGSGMGAAAARKLAADGFRVAILSSSGKGEALAESLGGVGVTGSNGSEDDLKRLVDATMARFGRIDALINSAGHGPRAPVLELTDEQWHTGMEVYFMNVVRPTRLVTPIMQAQGGGAIVNVSTFAAFEPDPVFPTSGVFRAGLAAFTKLFADRYAAENIRMNNVLPGFIDSLPENAEFRARIPMGRYGTVEEVAELIALLASDRVAYLTGQNIRIDGAITRSV